MGCASKPVSPLPGQSNPPVATTTAQTTAPARTTSTRAATSSRPTFESACLGPVVFEVDGADSADVPPGLCMKVGGVLRIRNIEPGVKATPAEVAKCVWEAGIANCRFNKPGNATITGSSDGPRTYRVTVIA
jgi:hypothetical protein